MSSHTQIDITSPWSRGVCVSIMGRLWMRDAGGGGEWGGKKNARRGKEDLLIRELLS